MFWVRKNEVNHCEECGEKLPQHSRVCPYCLYIKYFDYNSRCHLTPEPYLNIMRGYVDEMVALPMPKHYMLGLDRDLVAESTLTSSFEVVESVLDSTFCDNVDVSRAVALMSDIMKSELSRRSVAAIRARLFALVALLLLALFLLL